MPEPKHGVAVAEPTETVTTDKTPDPCHTSGVLDPRETALRVLRAERERVNLNVRAIHRCEYAYSPYLQDLREQNRASVEADLTALDAAIAWLEQVKDVTE